MQSPLAGTSGQALSDVEIARRIASGDRDELRCLMRRYNQRLYRTARSILRDDAEAEDCVQESYLSAFQAMASFRGTATLSTWLVRIVVNEAIGRARKRSRRAELITLDGTREHYAESDEADMMEAATEQPEHAANSCGDASSDRGRYRPVTGCLSHGIRPASGRGAHRRGDCSQPGHSSRHSAFALFPRQRSAPRIPCARY